MGSFNMNAATTPGNAACDTASPMNASPLSTTYTPTSAVSAPTSTEASSARCMKPSVSGCSSRSSTLPGALTPVVRIVQQDRITAVDLDDVAPVGGAQNLGVAHQRGRAVGDDRPVEAQQAREVLGHAREIVGAGQDGLATLAFGSKDRHQVVFGGRVDASHRLVQQ